MSKIDYHVEECAIPLYFDNGNGTYKYYDGALARVTVYDNNGQVTVHYVPVWNWGAGRAGVGTGRFNKGQIGLGRWSADKNSARSEMLQQMTLKGSKGYTHETAFPRPITSWQAKVRDKLRDVVTASTAWNTAVTASGGTPQPAHTVPTTNPHAPAKPDLGAANIKAGEWFELQATLVLTAGSLDKAVTLLTKVKTELARKRDDYETAESAVEMANAYVRAQLAR